MWSKIKNVIFNFFSGVIGIIVIILSIPLLAIQRSFIEIPKERKSRDEYRKKLALAKEQVKIKSWRRLDDWNEEDEKRERLTSKEVTSKLNVQIKNMIQNELIDQGFKKVSGKNCYRKIINNIVYEIHIYAPLKCQRGLRRLIAYAYPMCFIYQDISKHLNEESYFAIMTKECTYEPLFAFDCAILDNLIGSVDDIKDMINDEVFPFFDRFQTIKDFEQPYLKSYKKSDLSDIKGYYKPLRNAVLYIAEEQYSKAKYELEQIILSHEKYVNDINKLLQMFNRSLQDPKSYGYKNAESEIEYHQEMLNKYEKIYEIV